MLKKIGITFINLYQAYIKVSLPCSCRFWPSCSEYSKQALEKYGFFKGSLKACKRILRCQPFGKSGYDPLT